MRTPGVGPAVSIRSSVKPDAVACLECGAKFKMLKRHLSTEHGMTPEDYKARWNLGSDDGTINAASGTVTGLRFGTFPSTPDDAFNIATFTVRALAPGQGTLQLVSGTYVGKVNNLSGQSLTPLTQPAGIAAMPRRAPLMPPAMQAKLSESPSVLAASSTAATWPARPRRARSSACVPPERW